MHPKKVEQLADRIREHRELSSKSATPSQHLEAAHLKLVELEAVRRHMKAKMARCIQQRDKALLEVDQLRAELRKLKNTDRA